MPKSVSVNMRKVASKADIIFKRCRKDGIMSSSEEDKTAMDTTFPMMPKRPRREVQTPSMKNLTMLADIFWNNKNHIYNVIIVVLMYIVQGVQVSFVKSKSLRVALKIGQFEAVFKVSDPKLT